MSIMCWLAGLVLFAAAAPASPKTARVTAIVHAGEAVQRTIAPGIVFRVQPDTSGGWRVGVYLANDESNLAACVGIPPHGPTVLDVMAWNFAKTDHDERKFAFTVDRAGQDAACAEWDLVADGVRRGDHVLGKANFKMPPLGQVELRIRHVKLKSGSPAQIESFALQARFALP